MTTTLPTPHRVETSVVSESEFSHLLSQVELFGTAVDSSVHTRSQGEYDSGHRLTGVKLAQST